MKYSSRCWLYRSTFIQIRKTSCAVAYYRIQSMICGHASKLSPSGDIIAVQWPWHPPPRPCGAPRTALSLEVASAIRWRCACSSDGCSSDYLERSISLQQQKQHSVYIWSPCSSLQNKHQRTETQVFKRKREGWTPQDLFQVALPWSPTTFSLNFKNKLETLLPKKNKMGFYSMMQNATEFLSSG